MNLFLDLQVRGDQLDKFTVDLTCPVKALAGTKPASHHFLIRLTNQLKEPNMPVGSFLVKENP
ncbi:hypothetical protein ScFU1_03020 [Streptococcus canis]|nr:hypothetical protein ScFU1_03020 [Streptococcus canis]